MDTNEALKEPHLTFHVLIAEASGIQDGDDLIYCRSSDLRCGQNRYMVSAEIIFFPGVGTMMWVSLISHEKDVSKE